MVRIRNTVGVALVLLAALATIASSTHTLGSLEFGQVAETPADTQTNGFSGYMVAVG